MQKAVKILALLCALVMLVSLAACGGDKKDDTVKKTDDNTATEAAQEPAANLADFEWVKFEMPEGYKDMAESDSYVTIGETENSKHIIKFFSGYLFDESIEEVVKEEAEGSDSYTLDSAIEIEGRTWYPIRFTFNDNPSVKLYTDIGNDCLCYLTIYEMEENEPAVQTVLKSIEFDTSTLE